MHYLVTKPAQQWMVVQPPTPTQCTPTWQNKMNAGIKDKKQSIAYIVENERVQREIVRQKQTGFFLILLLFLLSIFGHLIAKNQHWRGSFLAASKAIEKEVKKKILGKHHEL